MSLASVLFRKLTEQLSGIGSPFHRLTLGAPGHLRARPRSVLPAMPLEWRLPWTVWHGLSWLAVTVLAPPFWIIGILLAINAHSDQPVFWTATMAIVAVTNGYAMVQTIRRYHRRPFVRPREAMLFWLGTSLPMGCLLFLLTSWATGMLNAFLGILSPSSVDSALADILWTSVVVAAFGVLSFVHAAVLHTWFVFRSQDW